MLKLKLSLWVFFCLWVSHLQANSFSKIPEISADTPIIFDQSKGALIAKENATLLYENILLGADELTLFETEGIANAKGNIYINKQKLRILADKGQYNLLNNTLDANNVYMGSYPLYLTGSSLNSLNDYLDIQNPVLYFADPDCFTFNLKANKASGIPSESIILKHAWLRIGKVPVFYWPNLSLSEQPIDVSSEMGKGDLGIYLKSSIFYKPTYNKSFKRIGVDLDVYDTTGILIGPGYDYTSTSTHSSLRSGYLHDRRFSRGVDSLQRSIKLDRYIIEYRHIQSLTKRLKVVAKLSAWSDSEILRQTRPKAFNRNRTPDNFIEGIYLQENYIFSTFLRGNPNNFLSVQQRLPELKFHYLPTQLGKTKIYQESSVSVSNIFEKSLNTSITQHANKLTVHYKLCKPVPLSRWATFTPIVGTRYTRYTPYNSHQQGFTHMNGEFGADLELKTHGKWNYENSNWEIKGLKHICNPIIQYRVLPLHKNGNKQLALLDRPIVHDHLDPIDLSCSRTIDPDQGSHLLRIGMNNVLQTQSSLDSYGVRNLADLGVYQDIHFLKKETEKTLSEIYTTFGLYPAHWLSFKMNQRIDAYTGKTKELNTSTNIKNGEDWVFNVNSSYLYKEIMQYSFGFSYRFTARYSFLTQLTLNDRLKKITRQSYGFSTRLGSNWSVLYQAAFSQNSSLESKESYTVRLTWNPI